MGLFRKKPTELAPPTRADAIPLPAASKTTEVDELRTELAALRARLDATDRENATLTATIDALNERLIPTPPPAAPVPMASAVSANQLDVERQLARIDRRLDALDARVTSVSTELANQVNELGNDIEPMQQSAERLAAEQARYQIAFRQDLAELAERLRRPRSH